MFTLDLDQVRNKPGIVAVVRERGSRVGDAATRRGGGEVAVGVTIITPGIA